ncbi:MAG: ATP-binding cassette domain-containing protein [Bacteroidetes bacterium]|nr:ATP-binding cassette domain-containing protein [Bacteroidota bacterium]
MSIIIENIHKSFGEAHVLKGIDFTFKHREMNMILGGSGGGKTVLLKTMVGLLPPDKGRVLYDGQDFWALDVRAQRALRTQIGMLFQGSALFDSMTVEENVAFPMQMLTNAHKGEIADRVSYCLERVNLPGKHKLFPSELSGGMKKRVGIARAIVLQPRYLFCDEPNSGLDPQTAKVIDELLVELTYEHEMTTIIISHDINSVLNIADHILFLYQGKKEWEGSRQQLRETDNIPLKTFLRTSGLIT